MVNRSVVFLATVVATAVGACVEAEEARRDAAPDITRTRTDASGDVGVVNDDAAADATTPDASADDASADGSVADTGAPLVDRAPRPIAPLSSSIATSRRPTLKWQRPAGVEQARVDLCSDRACSSVLASLDGDSSARPAADLPTGWVFWRVRARAGTRVGAQTSAVWQVWIPFASASGGRDTSSGTIGDFNGDGLADLVVGAPTSGGMGTGYVSIYNGRASGLAPSPSLVLRGAAGSGFGKTATSAGDVNGDGFADLIVGAWRASGRAGMLTGNVSLFHGSAEGLSSTPSATVEGPVAEERLGLGAAGVGDVDGDGYGDVVAGGPYQNIPNQPSLAGVARLFPGSARGIDASREVYWQLAQMGDWFGYAVGPLGDVNGDGLGDFAVGAAWADAMTLADAGQLLVVTGRPAFTLTGRRAFDGQWYLGQRANEHFGGPIFAGDLDNDGYSDVALVGDTAVADGRGRVALYRGGSGGLALSSYAEISGAATLDQLGFSGAIGDVNGDGYNDLLLGAVTSTQSGIAASGHAAIYVSDRSTVQLARPSRTMIPSAPYGGLFAFTSAVIGDINGDRFMDIVIGEPAATVSGRANAGQVHVGYGSAAGITTFPSLTIAGAATEDRFGGGLGR